MAAAAAAAGQRPRGPPPRNRPRAADPPIAVAPDDVIDRVGERLRNCVPLSRNPRRGGLAVKEKELRYNPDTGALYYLKADGKRIDMHGKRKENFLNGTLASANGQTVEDAIQNWRRDKRMVDGDFVDGGGRGVRRGGGGRRRGGGGAGARPAAAAAAGAAAAAAAAAGAGAGPAAAAARAPARYPAARNEIPQPRQNPGVRFGGVGGYEAL